ncbi:hypothetical protein GIB67_005120 [Kingdonia uniflora]|uniref:Uncharacterized protein n=1 Tax=Kingdonia uniflora TaxID=39325 RepID=A0A7J7PD53_9MAGN|nr:hypothetical protein GIB67_005120 [Kingdonia uniflora]
MLNVDFNDQCASSDGEDRQRSNIGGDRLQIGRHFLGKMDARCIHCSALHWLDEKLYHSSILNLRFGKYCFHGKIRLPTLDLLPTELQALNDGNGILSRSFRNYLREYNIANALTSLGVHMDDRLVQG